MRAVTYRLVLGALFLVMAVAPGWPAPSVEAGAGTFVEDLAAKVLAIFNDPNLSRDQKEDRMRPIAVKAFDVPRTARFVLGRYWKDMPAAQRADFTKTFEHYMVHIYTGQFDLYHDVEFRTVYTRPEGEAGTLVRTKIIRHDGGPPITVDWWVANAGAAHRISDVTVEGVSQLIALREQFASVIDAHGGSVTALIDHLREKIAD
jgi:phospholipid transport system substrate-binding protein